MSRREIVLLVSRAIAILQLIAALLDGFLYLPQQAFYLSQQLHMRTMFPGAQNHMPPTIWISVIVTLIRIAVLLIIAAIFWNCGPTIERMLLPSGSTSDTPDIPTL